MTTFFGPNSVKTYPYTMGNKLYFWPVENKHPLSCTHSKVLWWDSLIFGFKMFIFMCENIVLTLGAL